LISELTVAPQAISHDKATSQSDQSKQPAKATSQSD
jgi:hypothetical protein